MKACKNSGYDIGDHFGEVTEMVQIGSSALRGIVALGVWVLTEYCRCLWEPTIFETP